MSNEPVTIINVLQVLKELSFLAFGAAGTYVAFKGLSTWKNELRWSHKNELKRNILIELYRLESSIKNLRTAKLTTTVIDPDSDLSGAVQSYNSYAKRYKDEWDEIMEHRNALRSLIPEARATWDSRIRDIIDKLEPNLLKLHWAIHEQLEVRHPRTDKTTKADLNKDKKERHAIIFGQRKDDAFRQDIEQNIKAVEEYLEKNLK